MSEKETYERSEEPTQHCLAEARRRGNLPRSRDLTVASGMAASAALLIWIGPASGDGLVALVHAGLGDIHRGAASLSIHDVERLSGELCGPAALALAPLCLAGFLASMLLGVWQSRGVVRWAALSPDWTRLSPVQGLARICRRRQWVRAIWALAQVSWVVWLLWRSALALVADPSRLGGVGLGGVQFGWSVVMAVGATFCLQAAGGLFVLAWADYALEHWLHRRDLRMSREQIIEEVHELDGNPEIKQRRRRLQQVWRKSPSHALRTGGA